MPPTIDNTSGAGGGQGMLAMLPAVGGMIGQAPGGGGQQQAAFNDMRQYNMQQALDKLQVKNQEQLTDYNQNAALQMWHNTNYGPQMQEMEKAGLNPALMYAKGGMGGTASVAPGSVSSSSPPVGGHEKYDSQGLGIQTALMGAQLKLMSAQADKAQAEADKTKGPDTENTQQNTKLQSSQEDLNKIQQEIQSGSKNDQIANIKLAYQNGVENLMQNVTKTNVTQDTSNAQITKINADAITAVLTNGLVQAKVDNTEADTLVKNEQVNKMINDIAQGWKQLSQQEQKIKLDGLMDQVQQMNSTDGHPILGISTYYHDKEKIAQQIAEILNHK